MIFWGLEEELRTALVARIAEQLDALGLVSETPLELPLWRWKLLVWKQERVFYRVYNP